MSRRKVSTTIYITEEQNEQLKRLNEQTKVPVAEYIRQGIDLILERHRPALSQQRQLDFSELLDAKPGLPGSPGSAGSAGSKD